MRLFTVYGLVAALVAVPVHAASPPSLDLSQRSIAVAVTGTGGRFVLDREGQVIRVAADGSVQETATLDRYVTPFGTSVGGRMVFGGVRCDGPADRRCDERVAEVAVLDGDGRLVTRLPLRRASDLARRRLDGLALAGIDGRTVWVNGGGALFQVAVSPPGVAREIPWPGGEPCVVDHVLYDLAASGASYGARGTRLPSAAQFHLRLQAWTGHGWRPVDGGARAMPDGQNAYCTSSGYEIRDGARGVVRWTPAAGWQPVGPAGPAGSGAPAAPAGPVLGVGGLRVHHYNLCSAACGNRVRGHTRDVVAWFVNHDRPAAVSLNEVCYDDRVQLADRVPGYEAGAVYTALDTAAGCPGAVKQFGNLVLVRADLEPGGRTWSEFANQATRPCDHRSQECRGVACAEATALVGGTEGHGAAERVAFCSAHLESTRRDPAVAARQLQEYRQVVHARYGTAAARVLAGDFNLARPDVDQRLSLHGYRSASVGPTVAGHPAASQIDMVYVDGPGGSALAGDTYCDRQASDHCYLVTSGSDRSHLSARVLSRQRTDRAGSASPPDRRRRRPRAPRPAPTTGPGGWHPGRRWWPGR